MKIRNDHLEALRQEELQRAKQSPKTGMFADVLAKETATDDTGAAQASSSNKAVAAASLPLGVGRAEAATGAAAAENNPPTERMVMDHLDDVLTQWEAYASGLKGGTGEGGLRDAYGMLDNISKQVGQIKQTLPGIPQGSPALQSMVDELEIMTVTERFKFNRGDYS